MQLKKLDKTFRLYLKSLTYRNKSRTHYKNTQNRGYKHVINRIILKSSNRNYPI